MARVRARGPDAEALEERLGVRFLDRARLERALTHSSLGGNTAGAKSYERLEFLGDRVLGLTVAERLFQLFPKSDEGELSIRLNRLVSAEACAEIADELGLSEYIRHGADLKRAAAARNRSIRADVVEALIAAIYLDHGLEMARAFILRHWGSRLEETAQARRDPKTELQEWAHKRAGTPPVYELVDRTGPDHEPVFTVRAVIEGVRPETASGSSKRSAEQGAAEAILLREGVWRDADS